mgnify:CR=1 FL=1
MSGTIPECRRIVLQFDVPPDGLAGAFGGVAEPLACCAELVGTGGRLGATENRERVNS